MSLAVLTRNKQEIGFSHPLVISSHGQHIFEHYVLPWQKWHRNTLSKVSHLLDATLSLEQRIAQARRSNPHELGFRFRSQSWSFRFV